MQRSDAGGGAGLGRHAGHGDCTRRHSCRVTTGLRHLPQPDGRDAPGGGDSATAIDGGTRHAEPAGTSRVSSIESAATATVRHSRAARSAVSLVARTFSFSFSFSLSLLSSCSISSHHELQCDTGIEYDIAILLRATSQYDAVLAQFISLDQEYLELLSAKHTSQQSPVIVGTHARGGGGGHRQSHWVD